MPLNPRYNFLGLPVYRGTKAEIEAVTGIPEVAFGFASDTSGLGFFNGTLWTWGGGGSLSNPVDVLEYNTSYVPDGSEPVGATYWNSDDDTLDIVMNYGIKLQTGHELFFDVVNQTGSTIADGTPVMFAGTLGASGKVKIQKAIADGTLLSEYTAGIVTHTINNGDSGKATWFGKVRGIDTTGTPYSETWADGDLIWISQSTAGYLTNIEPAGGQKILVAAVIKAHSNGTLLVRPTWDGVKREFWENNASAGRLWGGVITDAGSGKINIAAGAGLTKTGGSSLDGNTGIPTALNEGQGSETRLVEWDAISNFPLAGVGYNLIYWDFSAGTFVAQLKENFYANFNFVTDFTIGRVYYDGSSVVSRLCGMNRWNFDRRVQMFGEERFPVERASGLMLSATGTRNIAVTAGVIWAELVNRFSVDAFDSSATGTFTYWNRDGSGGWDRVDGETQIDNEYWDDGTGVPKILTANRYGVHWIYVVHDSSVHVVLGQGDYTLAQAQQSTTPATLPGLLSAYASFIGRIIVKKNASVFTEIVSAFTTQLGASTVTNHNDLSGLQGGTAGEYYHLTGSEHTGLTGGGSTTLHTHPGGSGVTKGSYEADFGTSPVQSGSFTVTELGSLATSAIIAQLALVSPSDGRFTDEVMAETLDIQCTPGVEEFTLNIQSVQGSITGKFVINYMVAN